jgi:hypothetical protein
MPDRTINFGESETEATYQIQDTDGAAGGGNFVLAKDTNANTVLLQYDPTTDTWEYAGDVDMNGGNVSGVGALTAESVNTVEALIGNAAIETVENEVSTSEVLFEFENLMTAGLLIVYGTVQGSFDSFTDVCLTLQPGSNSPTVIEAKTAGTVANRDYSFNTTGTEEGMSVDSGTYDVTMGRIVLV